jgi:hypothetical protein
VDEAGHSGETGAADGGTGADPHDRALLNGWAAPDSPWSNPGSVLGPDDGPPVWRRPARDAGPFTQRSFPAERPGLPPGHPSGEIRPFGDAPRAGDIDPSAETRSLANPRDSDDMRPRNGSPRPSWSDSRSGYADRFGGLPPHGGRPADPSGAGSPGVDRPGPGLRRDVLRPETLQSDDARRAAEVRAMEPPTPASAPPYPYEGDLDEVRRDAAPPPVAQQRAAVPLERPRPAFPAVRPATPGGRTGDRPAGEAARHALEPMPLDGIRRVDENRPSSDQGQTRASYDPTSFPRRLPYDPGPYAGFSARPTGDPGRGPGEHPPGALPQRVPAEPDVPIVPEPPSVEPPAEAPALARIATHLRRGDVPPAHERQEGFDVNAILAAVREVDGVRDASLRTTPQGAHSLRLDLADGADPAEVSRQVARLLQDRMGLDAAMQGGVPLTGGPLPLRPPPFVPTQPVPAGRAPVGPAAPASAPPAAPSSPAAPRSAAAPVSAPPPAAAASATSRAPTSPAAGFSAAGYAPSRGSAEAATTGADCGPARPLQVGEQPGPRVLIENVQVNTFGTEATVEVRLSVGGHAAVGVATGPGVDGYLLRMCAMATAKAVDELLSTSDHVDGPAKCFVEHAASVPFGPMQVAVVVLLLSCGGWVEQLAGSAVVTGDERDAMVRATLAAVNRRLEALLS